MFVECNQAVCSWFGAACQEKKESLSIPAFKCLRVAMFIWKANIYCTHLHEVRNGVYAHACILIHTCIRSSRRNFNLWEGREDIGVRMRVFTPRQKFSVFLKMNIWSSTSTKLCGGIIHLKPIFRTYCFLQYFRQKTLSPLCVSATRSPVCH